MNRRLAVTDTVERYMQQRVPLQRRNPTPSNPHSLGARAVV